MAGATNKIGVTFSTTLQLNEVEIQALEALVCYGDEAFLRVFKANLGTAYIRDHEAGIRSLFKAINRDVTPAHRLAVQARQDLVEADRLRREKERARRAADLNLDPQLSGTEHEESASPRRCFGRRLFFWRRGRS